MPTPWLQLTPLLQEAAVVRAVAQRCRDRGEEVRRDAFALLARTPQPALQRCLHPADWQATLDTGLAGPLPAASSGGGGRQAAAKHTEVIRHTALQLLRERLSLERGQEGSQEEEAHAMDSSEREEVSEGGRPAWLARLQALQPQLPAELPAVWGGPRWAAAAHHLHDGWQAALQEVLTPAQLATVGGQQGSADAGDEAADWEAAKEGHGGAAEAAAAAWRCEGGHGTAAPPAAAVAWDDRKWDVLF